MLAPRSMLPRRLLHQVGHVRRLPYAHTRRGRLAEGEHQLRRAEPLPLHTAALRSVVVPAPGLRLPIPPRQKRYLLCLLLLAARTGSHRSVLLLAHSSPGTAPRALE